MRGRRAILESATLLAICLSALALRGCDEKADVGGSVACTSTADCGPGQSCNYAENSTSGHCVSSNVSSQLQVYLECQSATGPLPAIQVGPIQLSNGVNQSLVLPQPVSVNGTVQLGAGVATPVPGAQVQMTAQGAIIPGRTQQFEQTTDTNASFQMLLPVGSYAVRVTPAAPAPSVLPQPVPPPEYLGDISTSSITSPFVLSLSTATVTIAGTVTVGGGTDVLMFSSLLVSATDAAPQYNAVGAVPRSLAEPYTTGSTGAFSMLISPTIGSGMPDPVQLHVTAAPGGTPFPSFDNAVLPVQLTSASQSVTQNIALDVSAAQAVVSGSIVDANGTPERQATVYFVTQPGKFGVVPPFTYSTSVTTDASGNFSASLFTAHDATPVTYSIVAQPASETTDVSAGAPGLCGPGASVSVTVSSTGDAVNAVALKPIVCDGRTQITGSVVTSAGAIVSGAQIDAALKPTASYPIGLVFQTQTQADGSFAMALPSGLYNITITPPAGSGQPVYVNQGVSIGPKEPAIWQLQLFAPFNLAGKFYLGSTGQPFTGTFTAYVSDGTTATAVGQGVAAADGSYSILLPNVGQ